MLFRSPFIAFLDPSVSYAATVRWYNSNNAAWETLGTAGFVATNLPPLINVTSSGVPYIGYANADGLAAVKRYSITGD